MLLSLLVNTGCASWFGGMPKNYDVAPKEDPNAKVEFDRALSTLDRREFKESIKLFNAFLKKYPATKYELLAIYNLGVAYEGIGFCKAAINRYRRLINQSKGKFKRLEAQGLLRMSYSYECLGKDTQVVATLLDLQKRSGVLPPEVAKAEAPARLAAVYARLGNTNMAQLELEKARNGIKEINRSYRNPRVKKEILSKTFYYMGNMSKYRLNSDSSLAFIQSLDTLQGYLLKAVEFNNKEWSPLAQEELMNSYERLWVYTTKENPKVETTERILSSLLKLKEMRFPDREESPLIKELFARVSDYENKFKLKLANKEPGVLKTESTLEREKLKLNGRLVSPESKEK